jgi:hypothetical protein
MIPGISHTGLYNSFREIDSVLNGQDIVLVPVRASRWSWRGELRSIMHSWSFNELVRHVCWKYCQKYGNVLSAIHDITPSLDAVRDENIGVMCALKNPVDKSFTAGVY